MPSFIYTATRSIHANHTQSELISTGDFSSDINWTDFTNGTTGGSVTITGGKLAIAQGSNSVWMGAYQGITTTVGLEYTVTATVDNGTSSRLLVNTTISPGGSGSTGDLGTDTSEGTTQSVTFTATGTTSYVFLVQGASATTFRYFDDAACQLSGQFYLDKVASSLGEKWPTRKNPVVSINGTTETIYHRRDRVWDYSSDLIARSNLTSDYWYEMLDSINGGETFTFDPYGTIASPDNAVSAIMIGEARFRASGGLFYRVSFTIREI